MRKSFVIGMLMMFLLLVSCDERVANTPNRNQTPSTFLWLFPVHDTVGVGVSRQRLHWWGEDPDGFVRGYLFTFGRTWDSVASPDTSRYAWVTGNDTLMAFPLDTLRRDFAVFVRSVDNTFPGLRSPAEWKVLHPERPYRSVVRLGPSPYWDENDDGRFDSLDERLPAITPGMDPKGMKQTFPVKNTPPRIDLAASPIDLQPMKLPDTTFTAFTVSFKGSDDDGDNTIAGYRIALNDTNSASRWLNTPNRDTVLTIVVLRTVSDTATGPVEAEVYGGSFLGRHLVGRVKGLLLDAQNKIFIQARDVAGEYSSTLTLPSGIDRWYVKRPRGKILLVSDYVKAPFNVNPDTVYTRSLKNVPDPIFQTVDILDLGRGLTSGDKSNGKVGNLVPAFIDPALIRTFLLYDYVLWYTDKFPSLSVAQPSVFPYLQNQGKVIFSVNFQNASDPSLALRDIAPIDSIDTETLSPPPTVPPAIRGWISIPANYRLIPDSSDPGNMYPQLAFNPSPAIHSVFMRPVYRRTDAKYLYHLQADTASTPRNYIGEPNIAVIDGQRSIVFVGLPLHLLNKGEGLSAFFTKVLTQHFNKNRHINRRKF